MQSMGRSMDWTLEDNMVDVFLFCATHTGRRGGHNPFVQAGEQTSYTGEEAVQPDPGSSWEGHSGGVGAGVGDENVESCGGCPSTPHSIGDPPTAPYACCCCQRSWWDVVRRVRMGVSIWGALQQHSMDGWALSAEGVQAPSHGVLETVWLHWTKLSRLDACENWKVVHWCRTQASSHNSQGVFDGGVNEAGMGTAAPDKRAVPCGWMHQG